MKSALDIRVFNESLAAKCVREVTDMPMHILQGKRVTAQYLTRRSYHVGQARGLDWITDLDPLEPLNIDELENLIRKRLFVEKKHLAEQVPPKFMIDEKVSGVCNSEIGIIIDYIFSAYIALEILVADERRKTENQGPCESLRDVVSLGFVSALHWMLDEI